MSTDHLRHSISLSSSPGRASHLSRPHWPWSTYSHRSSQSSVSVHSTGTISATSGAQSSWEPRSSSSSTAAASPAGLVWSTPNPLTRALVSSTPIITMNSDESMRHWSFTAFEWIVRDVQKLKDFIERGEPERNVEGNDENVETERGSFEILNESPTLGDSKFKLEIARTPPDTTAGTSTSASPPTLSLYVTCLVLDYANAEFELSASILAAIKSQDRAGERGARPIGRGAIGRTSGLSGRRTKSGVEYPLPPLSTLLENPRIAETDSFVICIQIHTPIGSFFPQHPSSYYVPRDLLDGLEGSLDNPNTGDVQFICLERMPPEQRQSFSQLSPTPSAQSLRSSSSSSYSPFHTHTTVRKRVVYAHSDILTHRSDYFSTMLSSSFSENVMSGERKIYTIVVEEADFVTIYWLLKWVYADWLLFTENDDPRAAVEGVGAGWSARWLNARGGDGEWDWKIFRKTGSADEVSTSGRDDIRSATSGESVRSVGEGRMPIGDNGQQTLQPTTPSAGPMRSPSHRAPSTGKVPQGSSTMSRGAPSVSRRSAVPIPIAVPSRATSSNRSKTVPLTIPVPPPRYPLSPRDQRQSRRASAEPSTPDPHPHPTPAPPPASALSMYQIAHRYVMPGLASLALDHMMCTITPQSSFALLLATSVWEELHALVEDYVVDKWEEVSVSEEFERCCDEVAAGEWGAEGGKTLMALFRRLRSPVVNNDVRS